MVLILGVPLAASFFGGLGGLFPGQSTNARPVATPLATTEWEHYPAKPRQEQDRQEHRQEQDCDANFTAAVKAAIPVDIDSAASLSVWEQAVDRGIAACQNNLARTEHLRGYKERIGEMKAAIPRSP